MKATVSALMIAAVCVSGVSLYAHHSFAGTYIEDKVVTIEGKIVEFNIRNPHSFILIEVIEKDGTAARWGGEWGGVTQLSQGGVNRFTLRIGDRLLIDGAPARDSLDRKVLVRKVTRPATATTPEFTWQGRVQ